MLFPFYTTNMLAGVSVGFPPLLSKFTLSKCTLKLRKCIGTQLNFFFFFCGFFLSILWKSCTGGLDVLFFLVISFNYFFFEAPLLLPFYTSLKVVWSVFVYYSSRFITLAKVFFHLLFVKITVWWLPRREPQVFCSLSSPIVPCTAAQTLFWTIKTFDNFGFLTFKTSFSVTLVHLTLIFSIYS